MSLVLHVIIITLLIWSPLQKKNITASSGDNHSFIRAIMVNPSSIVEQYSRQYNRDNAQNDELLYLKKIPQKIEKLQQKQKTEQKHLRSIGNKNLEIHEKKQKQIKDVAQYGQAPKKAAKSKVKKSEIEVHKQAITSPAVSTKQANEINHLVAKKTVVQSKKQDDLEKKPSEIDALFDVLYSGHEELIGVSKQKIDEKYMGKSNTTKIAGDTGAEINNYIEQVKGAIQSKFYNSSSFKGKSCNLRIKISPDGLLISVQEIGGYPALCYSAVSAAKLAHMPKPTSEAVYQHFKIFTLDFNP